MTEQKVVELPASTDHLMEEAGMYSLLSVFFRHNPDAALVDAVKKLTADGFEANLGQPVARLLAYFTLAPQAEADLLLALKRDWTKLFRGVSPSYGPTAPYGLLFLKGNTAEMMADIAALYIDGGYDAYQSAQDRVDYIGIGFEYLQTLCLQMAHCVETRDIAEYSRLKLCRQFFLGHYFLPWVPEFCRRARAFVQTPFYGAVLDLTDAVLKAYAEKPLWRETELLSAEESRRQAEADEAAAKAAEKHLNPIDGSQGTSEVV